MSRKVLYKQSNKMLKFGILIAIVLTLIVSISTIAVTNAWFTGADSDTKNSTAPVISAVKVYDNNTLVNSGTVTLSNSTTIKLVVESNINVHLRGAYTIACYSGNNIVDIYNYTDYYTISLASGWGNAPSGYNTSYDYFRSGNGFATITAANTDDAISTNYLTITKTATNLPTGITVKLVVVGEAVQAVQGAQNSSPGLNKWLA